MNMLVLSDTRSVRHNITWRACISHSFFPVSFSQPYSYFPIELEKFKNTEKKLSTMVILLIIETSHQSAYYETSLLFLSLPSNCYVCFSSQSPFPTTLLPASLLDGCVLDNMYFNLDCAPLISSIFRYYPITIIFQPQNPSQSLYS